MKYGKVMSISLIALFLMWQPLLTVEADPNDTLRWRNNWSCGRAIKPNQDFVKLLVKQQALAGVSVNGVTLPILIGQRLEKVGVVMFVRRSGQWLMYPIAAHHQVQAIYSTPAANRLTLFSMWMMEGPGASYLIMRGRNQLADFDCQELAFPQELNQPVWANEFLELRDFNINADGVGAIIGSVLLERNGVEEKRWYQYSTQDWGRSWSKAQWIQAPTQPLKGVFKPTRSIKAPKNLVDSLLEAAH